MPFNRFRLGPTRTFFKRLFLGTKLGNYLCRMTDKAVPKGLRDQEVERAGPRHPPVSYIPVEDKIGDAIKEALKVGSFKIELPMVPN